MKPSFLCLSALLLPGCAFLPILQTGGAANGAYDGDECNEVRQTEAQAQEARGSGEVEVAKTPRERVLVAMCPELSFEAHDPAGRGYGGTRYQRRTLPRAQDIHAAFDLRHPSMLDVTSFLFAVVEPGRAQRRGHRNPHAAAPAAIEKPFGNERAEPEETTVGMAAVYASLLDASALDRELAATQLSAEARQHYKAQVQEASQHVAALVAAMTPAVRKVVYEIPLHVAQELRKEYEAKKTFGARLDVLATQADEARKGGGNAAKVALELTQLRSDVVTVCGATEECTYDPLYAEITHELATLYVATKQPELARAESALLARKDSMKRMFQPAVYAAQYEAGERSTKALEAKKSASKLDPKLAKAMDAEEPVSFAFADFFHAGTSLPFLASALGDGTHMPVSGYVQSISRKGDKSLVEFKTEYQSVDVPTNCYTTGRIARIQSDGRIEYEENCQYRTERQPLSKPDPVLVPSREAAGIKPGELATIWGGKEGVVERVHESKNGGLVLVQLRGDRVRGEKAERPHKSSTGTSAAPKEPRPADAPPAPASTGPIAREAGRLTH